MAMRWLGLLLVMCMIARPSVAAAAITIDPDPLTATDSVGGGGTSAAGTLTANPAEGLVDLAFASACAGMVLDQVDLDLTSGSAPVGITYTASARGTIDCTVNVFADGTTINPLATFAVRGIGIAPIMSITTAAPVDFGSVRVANAAMLTATRTVTIHNSGDDDLSVTALALSGTAPGDYSITAPATVPQLVAPNTDLVVTVVFDPSSSGTRTASLDITGSDPATPTASVPLTGVGTNAVITASDVAFGDVGIGSIATQDLTIANTATAPVGTLTVSSATITQTSTWFTFAAGTGCTAGSTICTLAGVTAPPSSSVAVRCNPPAGATGTQTGTVTFASDTDAGGDDTAALSCTGIAGHASVTPASLPFANVEVGATSGSQMVTVTNTGTANLVISNASLTLLASDYTITNGTTGAQSTTLGINQTATWQIACTPTTHGARTGTFRIVTDSDGVPGTNHDIGLTCTGQQGVLAIAPASHDFGGVPAGAMVSQDFTLSNTGNVAVNNIAAMISDPSVGYSITAPTLPIASLMAGGSVTVTVQFAPASGTDGGAVTAMFTGAWGVATATSTTTLSLTGDGLTSGFDVTPAMIDFGDLRFDTAPTSTFCIVNTSQAPVDITTMMITPASGTMTGEFSLPEIYRRACGTTGTTTPVTLPATLTTGQTLEVVVQADPADRTGAMAATVTVMSNLASMPTRTVALAGNSTTAMLTTTPGLTVDFGNVDLDAGPAMRTITITNTGTAPLDLDGFTRTASAAFTVALPGATVLQAGAQLAVQVTYTPTTEAPPNQSEQMILAHAISGVLNGPSMQMITVRGRGVDRHLELAPVPAFPDTFRNPGSAAPVRQITVTNAGEATLRISAVMVSYPEIWQVDTTPVDIPGQGTHAFDVRFAPTTAGKAPVGELVLTNDDNQQPMATILLNGTGLDRSVAMGDPVIDLGYTGIGIPVTLAGALSITSMDAANGFVIRRVELDDDSVFSIEGSPVDVALAPSTSLRFDVTFTPDAEGQFETRALLYLDEDNLAQSEVTLRGNAVFVDATGGGGCDAGGGAATGGVAIVLFGVLVLRRRRRTTLIAASAGLALLAVPATGHAQSSDLDLALFDPTPSTTGVHVQLQPASVGANGSWVTSAIVSYATNPLVLRFANTEHLSITRRAMMELGLAYAFLDRFEAGLRMPLYNQDGDGEMVGVASPSGTARGDLIAHVRAQLASTRLGASELVTGASLQVTLPTATEDAFAGVDKPTGRVLGLVTFTPAAIRSRLTLTANAGAVLRATTRFANIEQGSGVAWGLGTSFRVLETLWATAEAFGDLLPGAHRSGAMEPATSLLTCESLVGLSYRPERRLAIGLAVGRGLVAGIGTPDVRGVFSLAVTPGRPAPKPLDGARPSIEGARDRDGVRDRAAEPDRDQAPAPGGDAPPPGADTDGDGVLDAADKCPQVAENRDGREDDDGCPELDSDGDGIYDDRDKCPNESEAINGNEDDDGCPDRGDALVVLTPAGLELLDAIEFSGTKLSENSANVLGQIGATLRARSEILRLKIVVHTNPSNDPRQDRATSEARAREVSDWLVRWGIDPSRLSAQGMGGKKPLVPSRSKNAALLNDRVELIILERR